MHFYFRVLYKNCEEVHKIPNQNITHSNNLISLRIDLLKLKTQTQCFDDSCFLNWMILALQCLILNIR